MTEKKSAHLLQVGDEFDTLEFVVTHELNQQFLFGVEDFHPRYIVGTETEPPIVHPGLLLNMSNNTRSPSFCLPQNWAEIHAGEDTEYFNPLQVGKRVRVTWKVVEAYKKRDRLWKVLDIWIVDEDGVKIMRRKMINTFVSSELSDSREGG